MAALQPPAELLRWYVDMGADEAIGDDPVDRLRPPSRIGTAPPAAAPTPRAADLARPAIATGAARDLAAAATNLAELAQAVAGFEGCALRLTATHTVFADGNPAAPLMLIGEAPGAEEDRLGKPFVGRSGQLLDRMLAAIGIDRSSAYITNVIYWRPPGNRKPTPAEIQSCVPFVLRHIALVRPRVLALCGGTAAGALLGLSDGITRLRGRWFDLPVPGLDDPVATIATYHPSYLLRSPERKREAWRDLLAIKARLETPTNPAEGDSHAAAR
jgi:uracil-DNA glycosylase